MEGRWLQKQGRVGGVYEGRSGKYIVAFTENNISMTVSVDNWKGEKLPSPGEMIILENVKVYAKGRRADLARPI